MITSIPSPKEGLRMNEIYKDLANKLIEKTKAEAHCRGYLSTVRTTLRHLEEYLEANSLEFSPEIAVGWLTNQVRPNMSYEQFKQVRVHVFRVSCAFDTTRNLKPLFYDEEKLGPYDLLPRWAQVLIDNYSKYCEEKGLFYYHEIRLSIAQFLSYLIGEGFHEDDIVDCRTSAKYYLHKPSWSKGEPGFIRYLSTLGKATEFAYRALSPYFHDRIEVYDSVDMSDCPNGYSIADYIEASKAHLQDKKNLGYSDSAVNDSVIAIDEFCIFLELHGKGVSIEAVNKFLFVQKDMLGNHIETKRRTLLVINEILNGNKGNVPAVFSFNKGKFPKWAVENVSAYRAMRAKERMAESTLAMDNSSLLRFCNYLDSIGITSFGNVVHQHIKDFNLQDKHSTAAGKAAYNHRIRGFLRFLYEENVTQHDLSISVPAVTAVRVKPPVILTEEEESKLDVFLDTTDSLLAKALLKIATQTGMRSIDIVNLTFDSIDWENRTFRIVQMKTKVEIVLPFSNGVGNALYEYITKERPNRGSNYIFINKAAPFRPYTRRVVAEALARALNEKRKGSHILRKSFASKMTAASSTFSIVTDALGHTTESNLDPYISINEKRLKECALPLGSMFSYKGDLL